MSRGNWTNVALAEDFNKFLGFGVLNFSEIKKWNNIIIIFSFC